MMDWLSLAASLSGQREHTGLQAQFCEALTGNLAVSHAWVVFPCQQGRTLSISEGSQRFEWAVDDFSHPFAHVFQSSTPMLLDPAKLNYWQENPAFLALMMLRQRGESVFVMPLPPQQGQTKGIIVMTGNANVLGSLLTDNDWLRICEVFSNQYQTIKVLREEHQQVSALNSSIKRIRHDELSREQAYELKHVLIGDSASMRDLRKKVVTGAQLPLNVLICGDTGTGKELVAKALHELSDRKGKPFIAINCAAIPENLLESELFGHAKGAFSGAERAKKGLVADAQGGTLFLDEIGDMPMALQAKLLRVLETRTYRAVGSNQEITADFRLVAATHVAMKERIDKGAFRRDLFYRLNQFPVFMPSLDSRKEDIPHLVRHFVEEYNTNLGTHIAGVQYGAFDLLDQMTFPGNVRELRNIIEYACAMTAPGEQISADDIGGTVLQQHHALAANSDDVNVDSESYIGMDITDIDNLKAAVRHFESRVIRYRLLRFGGDRSKAAESLGLPKRTLADKCLKMEID